MQDFYYHPILGLQYSFIEVPEYLYIDIESLPKFDIEIWENWLRKSSILEFRPSNN